MLNGFLKQSTASQTRLVGPFIDDTDFKTLETGLTIANTDVKLSANGGTSANKNSGGGTHIVNGKYALTFDATDTATVGELDYSIAVSGALVVTGKFMVLEEAIYDALFGASAAGFNASGQVAVGSIASGAITAASIASGALTSTKFAAGAFDAVWSVATRLLTAGTNIVLAKGVGVTGFNDISAADVNAQVLDVMNVDTFSEPGQGAPSATPTIRQMLHYLYKSWRNKKEQTATTFSLYDDAGTTVDQKATVSDDGTTATRGEVVTGP